MVRLLANEHCMQIAEWNESFSFFNAGVAMEQLSPLNSFQQFLEQNSVGYTALACTDTSTHVQTKKKKKSRVVSFSQPDSLQRSRQQQQSRSATLILLDDLPYLHTPDAKARFRNMLQQHIQHTSVPTVWIVSDVVEGKYQHGWLEDLVDLSSPLVRVAQINPPTQARFGKLLQKTVQGHHSNSLTKEALADLYERTGGDVRAALNTLQYQQVGEYDRSKCSSDGTRSPSRRDKKLSTFHALGKLLYAKRVPPTETSKTAPNGVDSSSDSEMTTSLPPLSFDPETVVEQSGTEVRHVLSFVAYHAVDFFTDVTELSTAMDDFSNAAYMLDQQLHHYARQHQQQLSMYAASWTSRAVANANRHPAATKFRHLSAPAVYQVERKRQANAQHLARLQRQQQHQGTDNVRILATERVPYAKLLRRPMVGGDLQSYFATAETINTRAFQIQQEKEWRAEQEALLRQDDIGEFGDESDDDKGMVR